MKSWLTFLLTCCFALSASAQIKRPDRRSQIDREPDVVQFPEESKKPIMLKVIKESTVFSDKEGKIRLGTLRSDQTVRLEAMTARAYKVRGKGTGNDLAGWVSPSAFSSKDPNFVDNLKKLYERQIQVQKLIDAKQVAVGMTPEEVAQSLGKPTKTTLRKEEKGESGRWEYIDYDEVTNYATVRDPITGLIYRQAVSVTQVEKGKTSVDFVNGFVSAVEETEDRRRRAGNTQIIVPPLVFSW